MQTADGITLIQISRFILNDRSVVVLNYAEKGMRTGGIGFWGAEDKARVRLLTCESEWENLQIMRKSGMLLSGRLQKING